MSIPSLLTGFFLGAIAFGIFALLMQAHYRRPRTTMAGRRKTGRPQMQPLGAEFEKVLRENLWDLYETEPAKQEERGVNYQWINIAGERE